MDFSKVKSITIPEGTVKQIADANGNVIWKGTVNITVTAPNCVITGDIGEVDAGSTYTVTITANSGYYFTSYTSGATESDSFTLNNTQTKYKVLTYTGTANNDITITASTDLYYSFTYTDASTHTEGTLTFNTTGSIKTINGNNQFGTVYYTGNLAISLVYYSRLTYAGTQGYSADDRVIKSYSGATSYESLGSKWLGDGTGYKTVTCSQTINANNYTFSVVAVDSRAGDIITNGLSVTITNSNTSKSYTSSSDYEVYTSYSGSTTSLTINNKNTTIYNYYGEGSVTLGDGAGSPSVHTVSRSVKSFTYTLNTNSTTYCSMYVNRNSSPYAGAGTGRILTGNGSATVYYGDNLTIYYSLLPSGTTEVAGGGPIGYEVYYNGYHSGKGNNTTFNIYGNRTDTVDHQFCSSIQDYLKPSSQNGYLRLDNSNIYPAVKITQVVYRTQPGGSSTTRNVGNIVRRNDYSVFNWSPSITYGSAYLVKFTWLYTDNSSSSGARTSDEHGCLGSSLSWSSC